MLPATYTAPPTRALLPVNTAVESSVPLAPEPILKANRVGQKGLQAACDLPATLLEQQAV